MAIFTFVMWGIAAVPGAFILLWILGAIFNDTNAVKANAFLASEGRKNS